MPTAKTIGQLSAAASVTTTDQLAAENAAGSANSKYTIAQIRGWDYDSGNQTITVSSTLTLAHGLGVVPRDIQDRLVCLTAEFGYSVGEELFRHDTASSTAGIAVSADTTNVYVTFGAVVPQVRRKDTFANASVTAASWALRVRANA